MRLEPTSNIIRQSNVTGTPNIQLHRHRPEKQTAVSRRAASQARSAVDTATDSLLIIRNETISNTISFDADVNTIYLRLSLHRPTEISKIWYGVNCPRGCTTSFSEETVCMSFAPHPHSNDPNAKDDVEEGDLENSHITIDIKELRVQTRDQRFEYLTSVFGVMMWDEDVEEKLEDVFRDSTLVLEGPVATKVLDDNARGVGRVEIGKIGDIIRECEFLRSEMREMVLPEEGEEEEEFEGFEECQKILEEAIDAFNQVVENTVSIFSPPVPEADCSDSDDEEMDDLLTDWSIDFESVERDLRAARFRQAFKTCLQQLDRLIDAFHRLIEYVASLGGRFGDLEVESLGQSVKVYEELRRQPGLDLDTLVENMQGYQSVLQELSWGQPEASSDQEQTKGNQMGEEEQMGATAERVVEERLVEGWGEAKLCWYRYFPQDASYNGFVVDDVEPVTDEEDELPLCDDPAVLGLIEAVVDRGLWPESVDSGFESDGSVQSFVGGLRLRGRRCGRF